MRVAVDARNFWKDGQANYLFRKVFLRLSSMYSQHEFYFFLDQPPGQSVQLPGNVKLVVLAPLANNLLKLKFWFDVKVASALRRHQVDVLVAANGVCSKTTKVPQIVLLPDPASPNGSKLSSLFKRPVYKRLVKGAVQKARFIVVSTNLLKDEIINQYTVDAGKVMIVPGAVPVGFAPVEWEEREAIKEAHAQGCEYLVFTAEKNVLALLKAFSLFKKRQQTNMKLLITGSLQANKEQVADKLKTYKFRHDVLLTGELNREVFSKVVAGAYAFVQTGISAGFDGSALEAMQCSVPVIAAKGGSLQELCGEAALYVDENNEADVAEKMKMLYKDEGLRSRLIADGLKRTALFDYEQSAKAMWQVIEQALST